jgi:hypothetical protein
VTEYSLILMIALKSARKPEKKMETNHWDNED